MGRYLAGAWIFLIAVLLRVELLPVDVGYAFLTFYPATALCFYLCGAGPGLVMVGVCAVAGHGIFQPSFRAFVGSPYGYVATGIFVFSSCLVGLIVQRLRDLSARLRGAMSELRSSEQRYRMLLEDQTDLICRFKGETLLYVNDAFCRFFGKEPESLIGRAWHPVVWPEDLPMVRERLAGLNPGNPVVVIENRVIAANGALRWGQFINQGFFDEVGSIVELQAVGRDITERKEAEHQSRDLLERISRIATRIPGMIYEFRLRPDGSSCFPYASEAIREIYGVGPEDVGADSAAVFAVVHPEDREVVLASLRCSAATLAPWDLEYRVCSADGTVRWLHGSSVPQGEADGSVLWHGFITDITERKIKEVRLQALSIAVEQSPTAVVITDLDANIEYVNEEFVRVTGYDREALIGQNPRILRSGFTDRETLDEMWRALTHGHSWHGELINRKKSGALYWEEAHIAPVFDSHGHITRYVGVKLDVTGRKLAEQALRRESEKNRMLLQHASDGIFVLGTDARIVEVSNSVCDMLGYSREELIGMHLSRWDADYDEEGCMALFRSQFEAPVRIQFERRHRRKDGTIFPVEISGCPVDLEGARVLFNTCRDITARKQSEQALAESERKFRRESQRLVEVIWGADIGTWEWNIETGATLINDRWAEIVGYSVEELAPTSIETWSRLVHPEDLERSNRMLERCFKREAAYYQCEVRMRHKDGRWVWVLDRGKVVQWTAEDQPLRMSGTHQDISDRVHAESRLRELNQDFNTFLEGTSDLVYFIDAQLRIRFCSENLARAAGVDGRGEMVGRQLAELFREDVAKVYMEHNRDILRDGLPRLNETEPYYDAEGSKRWVISNKWPMFDGESGRVSGLFAIGRDITELLNLEEQLKDSEALFHGLFGQSTFLAGVLDGEDRLVEINETALGYIAADCGEVIGRYFPDTPWWRGLTEDKARLLEALRAAHQGQPSRFEATLPTTGHQSLRLLVTVMPITLEKGLMFAVTGVDVTDRWLAEQALKESESRFRILSDNAPVLVWMAGPDQSLHFFNQVWLDFTGRSFAQELGYGWTESLHPDDRQPYLDAYATAFEARRALTHEYRLRRQDGEYRWITAHGVPHYDGEGHFYGYIGSCIDVTEQHEMAEFVQRMAYFDYLTQLPNRRLLDDRLGQAMVGNRRHGKYGALIFLDLDNFKPLNDRHGHATGDLLLIEAARRIAGCVREMDTVSRFGGDEFVILLGELEDTEAESKSRALLVAEKLRVVLSEPYELRVKRGGDEEIIQHHCTSSIGVALFGSDGQTADDVLTRADKAMYRAKELGRNAISVSGINTV